MTEKEALEILGLKQDYSKIDVENRFNILLKKHKAGILNADELSGRYSFEEITQAYNYLMGYHVELPEEPVKPPNPILKKMGIDEKKAKNFLYYYKYHIIGIVIILAMLFSIVKSCVTKVTPDVNVVVIGNIYFDSEQINNTLLSKFEDFKYISVDGATFFPEMDPQQQYAMTMKKTVLLGAADVDIFVVDKNNFEELSKLGAFAALDDYAAELGIDINSNAALYSATDDDPQKRLYGIDVSTSKVLEESKVLGEKKIVALSIKARNINNAKEVIKLLVKQ